MTLIEELKQLLAQWEPKDDKWSPYGPTMGRKQCADDLRAILDRHEPEVEVPGPAET